MITSAYIIFVKKGVVTLMYLGSVSFFIEHLMTMAVNQKKTKLKGAILVN